MGDDETMSGMQRFLAENASLIGAGALTMAATVAATAAFLSSRAPVVRFQPPLSLDNQSINVGTDKEKIYVSAYLKAGEQLSTFLYEDAKTVYQAFQRGLRLSNDGPCLGTRSGPGRKYTWLTYKEILLKAQSFGSGLQALGVSPGNSTFIGIYCANCVEWAVADLGCQSYSMVAVPLYDSLGPEACKYIINETELCTVVCDDSAKALKLLMQADVLPSLRRLVMVHSISPELQTEAPKRKVQIISFEEVEKLGKRNLKAPQPPKPDDLATLCYTSGTTGDPKGVMLTHANLMINLSSVYFQARGIFKLMPNDMHLSYLPLAHMFERGMHLLIFMHGAQIGYFQGDIRKLTEDMMELRPTLFPTVPRLLNRIYDKVQAGINGSRLKSLLLKWALNSKMEDVKQGIIRNDSIWDKLVFGKIQKQLGGRIRIIITGSAPLSTSVLDFVRCAFGCLVMEGYGQTEATAGITFNVPGETQSGNVGNPLTCNFVKLVDVPEMDYFAKDNKGEICAKGGNVMKGYYRNPEKTAEALDADGWLHTGDIGMWLPNGTLKIIDRKKNIFKLAQGEYVAVERVENVYQKSMFVGQCFVEGNSLKPCLMAVVVPDEEVCKPFAAKNGLPIDMVKFCQSQEAREIILKDMLEVGKKNGLKGFEQTKDIYLHAELFSVDNDLLTPTMKNKRPSLRKVFKDVIEGLYEKHKL